MVVAAESGAHFRAVDREPRERLADTRGPLTAPAIRL